ncbi:MAG: hypothetical protein BWK79_03985 [Beggiatoa sp. IS2]|nr:MAG: hypothetical protein BWK79_03985 [Beggiatoa sp. IS2]
MPLDPITYDALPYVFNAMPYAQPDRLATLATLFGIKPPPVPTCRVLELGCGDGSNLIATAHSLPKAECLGIDMSAQNIAQGQMTINTLGLSNVTLKQMDILEIDDNLGQFDYIIAHGIYSWVLPTVQDKILSVCKRHLVSNGVAYVSYNTKPGWNVRNTLRDMMHYHIATVKDPEMQARQLKILLKSFTDAAAILKDAYGQLLQAELKTFSEMPANFALQQFLVEENRPVYFYEFIERAHAQGLYYLADAHLHTMIASNFFPEAEEIFQPFSTDLLQQEQSLDFLRNRAFRHTLLCHEGTSLNRTLTSGLLKEMAISSSLRLIPGTVANQPEQRFQNNRGYVATDRAFAQAALYYLGEQWPRAVPFTEMLEQAQRASGQDATNAENVDDTAEILLRCYLGGLIEVYRYPPSLMISVSERPQASRLAQWQATRSQQVTNLRCESLNIANVLCLQLLPHLDGTRDRTALLELVKTWIKQEIIVINVQQENREIKLVAGEMEELLPSILEEALHLIARSSLLMA